MNKTFLSIIFLAAMSVLFTACDNAVVYEQSYPVENGVWNLNDVKTFEFNVEDTLQLYNFYVTLRNGEEYPFSNLYLFIEMEFPNGKKSVDTLECPLADAMGNWYGSGLGSIFDNRVLFRERKKFPLSGNYKLEIHQAMRQDDLKGIYDVGFRLALPK
ncbi:MAG: gliding motility lipoprotein GldH [Flavobacteriales bacterium]